MMDQVQVSRHTVAASCADEMPPEERHYWSLSVELVDDREPKLWAVRHNSMRLNRVTGEMDWEWSPSNRPDGWNSDHSYSEDEAIAAALAIVDTIRINGRTAAEAVAYLAVERAAFLEAEQAATEQSEQP